MTLYKFQFSFKWLAHSLKLAANNVENEMQLVNHLKLLGLVTIVARSVKAWLVARSRRVYLAV